MGKDIQPANTQCSRCSWRRPKCTMKHNLRAPVHFVNSCTVWWAFTKVFSHLHEECKTKRAVFPENSVGVILRFAMPTREVRRTRPAESQSSPGTWLRCGSERATASPQHETKCWMVPPAFRRQRARHQGVCDSVAACLAVFIKTRCELPWSSRRSTKAAAK